MAINMDEMDHFPEQARFRQLCDRVAEVFARHDVTAEDLLESLPEARKQVFSELYPELAEQKATRTDNGFIHPCHGGLMS